MTALVVRTDDILDVRDEDVRILRDGGLDYAVRPCLTEEDVIRNASGAAGLLVLKEPITAAVLDANPTVKVVARFGVGVDTVDLDAASERGVRVVNVPDANSPEVAAHAIAMIMSLTRRLPQLDASLRRGEWDYLGPGAGMRRLTELRLGVLGFGRIGRLVAGHARALGFAVQVHDPYLGAEAVAPYDLVSLERLVATSDVVSVHVPLSASTAKIIGARQIAAMKPDAILVNVSRGGLIDEDALAEALVSGHLAGAGLDAFASEPPDPRSPLLSAPGLIATPHAGHYSEQSYRETIQRAIRDVIRVIAGEEPLDPVN